MLRTRILTAFILLPLVLVIIGLAPAWLFALVSAAVFLATQWEWIRIGHIDRPLWRWLILALTALLMTLLWYAQHLTWVYSGIIIIGVLFWLTSLVWLGHHTFAASPTYAHRTLKLLTSYIVLLPAWLALIKLRDMPHTGQAVVLLLLCIVWAADIGAYFSGRLFGKRKLAPSISPGKTLAGAWGGIILGVIVAIAGTAMLTISSLWLVGMAILGLFTVCASIVGDLFESMFKRHSNLKDSSQLLPGHGGLWDRLDSLFAALPVFATGLMGLGIL